MRIVIGFMSKVLLVLLVYACLAVKNDPKLWRKSKLGDSVSVDQQELWFTQVVDHFNYQKTEYWQMRYFAVNDYFNPATGPVVLFICGEFECPGVAPEMQWIFEIAKKTQALILVPEHRYYGKSMPFGNQSLDIDKLIYLNAEQALADLANFINGITNDHKFGVREQTPWVTYSGSYPGALAAWMRYKYPHLVVGALASSAVIVAIEDFKDFDEQIYSSLSKSGIFCVEAVNRSNSRLEQILDSDQAQAFKSQFQGGQKLTNDQFLFFWSDAIVVRVQYGSRVEFCEGLKGKTEQEQVDYLIQNAKNSEVYQYGSYFLKNTTFAMQTGTGSRAWYYQSCAEFGYWQTYSDRHPMRSKRLNLDFYRKFCNDSFGTNLWPKVSRKNLQLGGLNETSSNVVFLNGVEDPWRWATLQQSKGTMVSVIADCDNCAHIFDIFSPLADQPAQIVQARETQLKNMQNWIQQHWKKLKK